MKKICFATILLLTLAFAGCQQAGSPADAAVIASWTQTTADLANAQCTAEYDKYFDYYTKDEYTLMSGDYAGSFGGVGISMTMIDNSIVVYSVLDNTPAAASRIQSGDKIISVDGESVVGASSEQAALLIRGEVGSPVTLELQHEDGTTYTETLTRDTITSQSVSGEILAAAPDVAYFLVYDFTEQTADEFVTLFNDLQQEQPFNKLIIDLRSNGGGSFFAAINIANYFIPSGHVIVSEKTATGTEKYKSNSGQLHGVKIAILQNEWTASASEVLIGALRDEADATVIGTVSFGKGITQSVGSLDSGAALRYTRSRYYTPSGFDLHEVGITPDIAVTVPQTITNEEYFSTDPALNPHLAAALEQLGN